MGNGLARCCSCSGGALHGVAADPCDEGLGQYSFFYVRPEGGAPPRSSKVHHHSEESTTFRSISGASVSANASTPLSTASFVDPSCPPAAAFESSVSFSSVALLPSGPLDRGFLSGPLDRTTFSPSGPLRRSLSHALRPSRTLLRTLTGAIARTVSTPIKTLFDGADQIIAGGGDESSGSIDAGGDGSVQWAQGKAGEDRVHVVISEEHEWVFVGIYDGFNGPDATDYLLSNLYSAVQGELKGLLWDDMCDPLNPSPDSSACQEHFFPSSIDYDDGPPRANRRRKFRGAFKKWEEKQRRWKCEWNRERLELDRRLKEQLSRSDSVNHSEVLKALSRALKRTEEAYLDIADKMVSENPELALMGSCVLVMLMKGEDVYLMNVGDSRAVLARTPESEPWVSVGKPIQDLARISEETMHDLEVYDDDDEFHNLAAIQLTLDHSTSIDEEVRRIKREHPDDAQALSNDRVKGSLKVTRAFGAGFLKQPKWNNALLEMFRIDYVGTSPYITCNPFLHHHRLVPKDRFLILSSDGLYQYLTNEEAVSKVELFISTNPEGDPAQHLVEEVLFRAAEKAGINFHELLEIPHGDRRRYHDDVSIIVISLEGRIWRSFV